MNNIAEKIKSIWEYLQDLMDVRGDVVMMALTSAFIFRVVYAAWSSHPAISPSEAALYSSAIAAFAYSNTGKPKS